MKHFIVFLVVFAVTALPSGAISYYVAPDVPTDLAAATYLPWNVIRQDSGSYAVALSFPQGTSIDALYRLDSGMWLFSVKAPTTLGGTTYDPRDVIRRDGINYNVFWSGAGAGVSEGSNVDAAFLDGGDSGELIVSFDVPTTIAGQTYDPADLVRYSAGSFHLFFDASAANPPIPASSNVIAASRRGAGIVLSFDVPTTLGAATYLPGDLVSWDGASFALFYRDPNWPISSRAQALSFPGSPGMVPITIRVEKSSMTPGNLTLRWSPSCSVGGEDYGIYEGQIGAWYSHSAIDCSDDGDDLVEEIVPAAGNRYYLVTPSNANAEGSYGTASGGMQRPVGVSGVCRSIQEVTPCP